MKQLGDILLAGGLVTTDQLAVAMGEQQRLGRSLGRVLVDQGVLTESQLVASLAAQIGMRFVDLGDIQVDGSALARVPGHVARRHTAIPIGFEEGKLVVAMADPANVFAIDDIKSVAGAGGSHIDVKPVVATRNDVVAAIDRYYRAGDELDDLTTEMDTARGGGGPLQGQGDHRGRADRPVREPADHPGDPGPRLRHPPRADRADLRVRYRIDGVLHEVMRSPRAIQSGVISRLKIMADINIAERRIPQDGRLSVNAHGKKIDLRVATLPTVWGEKVVMRILDNSTARMDLTDLGFSPHNFDDLREVLREALRDDPGDRADRLREVDDAVRHAQRGQQARGQHHHGRGPGRVPAARHQPGAGQQQGRPQLRRRAALDPALGPRRRPHR